MTTPAKSTSVSASASPTQSQPPFLGRGWSFPPTFSEGGGDVEMVSGQDDVQESLQIILGTLPGERVMQDSFGCALQKLLFEELDQRLLSKIERLISDALLEHEPRIELQGVDVTEDKNEPFCVIVSIKYAVRGTNSRFNMVFPFYLMEAAHSGL